MTQQEVYEYIKTLSNNDNVSLTALERQMVRDIIRQINSQIVTSGGKVVGLNSSAGNVIKRSISTFYRSPAYRNSIAKILKNLDVAVDEKLKVYKDQDLEISKDRLNVEQKLVIDEFIDNLSEDGLNSRFNQPLRNLIYDNIRNNLSQNELLQNITNKIESGKIDSEFGRYVKNATRQAADAYTSIVDKKILEQFKDRITHIRVVGTLIETSSPQCRQAIEKYDREIPVEKLDNWIRFAIDNGASEELTIDNLPVLKGHFGCRHQWIPIIKT